MMRLDSTLQQFLAHLYRGGKWAYWWLITHTVWFPVDKPVAVPHGKHPSYFGVHPTAQARGKTQRARIQDIAAINCLFAEFDAKDFADDKTRILTHIAALPIAPSVMVDSGGGFHCYWLLREPFGIANERDRRHAKQLQADWVVFVGGDPGAKDLARVLRVPGTLNHKYDPPRPVKFVRTDFERAYKLAELNAAIPRGEPAEPPNGSPAHVAGNGYSRYAFAALSDELDKLPGTREGARNDQLNKSAFALGQLIGAHQLDREDVETKLANMARRVGLTEREIQATIRSGIEAGMREPRVIPSHNNGHEPRVSANAETIDDDSTESLAEQAGRYLIRDGRICRRKRNRDGNVIVPLCNFAAQIVEEVSHDDGAEIKRLLTITGKRANDDLLPAVCVDASQFASMRWVTPHWGSRAIIEAGASAQDHLRAAIQYLSPAIKTRHVYAHTGWRELDGKRVFLTQSGAVGDETIPVELEQALRRYTLPAKPTDVGEGMRESLRFLDLAPKCVTVPLWSAMFLAPLASLVSPRFIVWLYGVTGAMKSTLAALALCHYGDFEQDFLIQWSATANALEKYLFLAKDVPFVIDDYAPQFDSTAARKLEETVARIVRGVGNRSGRARMKSDLSLRDLYVPRGLVISTGEQLPEGQSLVARCVSIEISKPDVDLERLSRAQDNRAIYRDAMAGYIQWLSDQWQHLESTMPARWRELRAKAKNDTQHRRVPEALASLYLGFDLGVSYAVHVGALGAYQANELRDEGWDIMLGIAEHQQKNIEEQRPTVRFLTVINELIAQGAARLNQLDHPNVRADNELLGWQDRRYLYLLPSVSYHCVARFEREQGRNFGIRENALRKALVEDGILVADAGHHTASVRIARERRRVLKLSRAAVEKISGGYLHKSGVIGDR